MSGRPSIQKRPTPKAISSQLQLRIPLTIFKFDPNGEDYNIVLPGPIVTH